MNRRFVLKTTLAATLIPSALFAATTHTVTIKKFKFDPEALNVSVGDTIIFINEDGAKHTATADDKSWTTERLKKGQSGEITVTAGMTGGYFCNIHRKMKGTLNIG